MKEQTIQVALAQLAMLIFKSMALVLQSKPTIWIAILLMLSLSFSLGTALACITKFFNKKKWKNLDSNMQLHWVHI